MIICRYVDINRWYKCRGVCIFLYMFGSLCLALGLVYNCTLLREQDMKLCMWKMETVTPYEDIDKYIRTGIERRS